MKSPELRENYVMRLAVETFPYKTDSAGVCEKLVDNKCSVYNDRPLLCNVKQLGEAMRVNQTEWFKANAMACNRIIDSLNLDSSYKITDF